MRRRRALLVILGGIALAGAAVLYWLLFVRLSAEERQLIGRWSRVETLNSPGDVVLVLELNDDRTSRLALFDAASGQPMQKSIPARWSVQSGKLTFDYEIRTLGRLARGSPRLQSQLNIRPMNRETVVILAVEPTTLRLHSLMTPPGAVQVYTRSGEQYRMPPIFAPGEQLGY
jgi:hypothetical protein